MGVSKDSVRSEEGNISILTAYNRIPYAIINKELEGKSQDVIAEFNEISEMYKVYKRGASFSAEGTGGNYVAANLRYKKVATLINKEARFLFGQRPDINVKANGDVGKVTDGAKDELTNIQNLIDKVLVKNKFESILLKAAKDCFIGKRIALMVNFNEEYGVTIQFIPSLNFVYETRLDNKEVISKFVCFMTVKDTRDISSKRIFVKKFEMQYSDKGNVCYLEEGLYDGAGNLIEQVTEYQPTLLDTIPVEVIINDGLTDETDGESEVGKLAQYEEYYSKLASGDIDAERKGMNQIKYSVDMSAQSTKGLSTSPGSFWDLTSDQNLDHPAPSIGTLENNMGYSQPLDTTLKRIRASMYEEVDVPDVTLENLQGVITSGKSMKCLYWSLIVRCQEKMKAWGPALSSMADIIIKGAMAYPNCIKSYTDSVITPVDYEIEVLQNYPLPEDEEEEKNMDLAEVAAGTMSRKSYMKKWRMLTDDEVQEELTQMALEMSMLEGSNMEYKTVSEEEENVDVMDGMEEEDIMAEEEPEDTTEEDIVEEQ